MKSPTLLIYSCAFSFNCSLTPALSLSHNPKVTYPVDSHPLFPYSTGTMNPGPREGTGSREALGSDYACHIMTPLQTFAEP